MKSKWALLALVAISMAFAVYMFHASRAIRNGNSVSTPPTDLNSEEANAESEWCIPDLSISSNSWFTDAATVCQDNLFVAHSETNPLQGGNHNLVVSVVSVGSTLAPSVFQQKATYVIHSSPSPMISSLDSTGNNVYILLPRIGGGTFGRSNGPLPITIDDWVFERFPAISQCIGVPKLQCTNKYAFVCYYSALDYSVYLMYKDLERESSEWERLLIESRAVSEANTGYAEVYMAIAGDELCIFYNVEDSLIDIDLQYAVVCASRPDSSLWRDGVWNDSFKCKWAASAANDEYIAGLFRNREENSLFVAWLESGQLASGSPWHITPVEIVNRVGGSASVGIRGDVLEVVYRDLDSNSLVYASIPVQQRNLFEHGKEVLDSEHMSGTGMSYVRTSAYEIVVFGQGLSTGGVRVAYRPTW